MTQESHAKQKRVSMRLAPQRVRGLQSTTTMLRGGGSGSMGETDTALRARAILDAVHDLHHLRAEAVRREQHLRAATGEALRAIEALAAAIYREAGTRRRGREEEG